MGGIRISQRSAEDLSSLLPHPDADANKYTRGKLVFIGGCNDYPGAACLACSAAQRMGAGYVQAFCGSDTVPILRANCSSVVVRGFDALERRDLACEKGHPSACLIGPGMDGRDEQQSAMMLDMIDVCDVALAVDGGALRALATERGIGACIGRAERGLATVLTPHMGEAAALATQAELRPLTSADPDDLAGFAADLSSAYGATVLLKGPDSYISPADARWGQDAEVVAMRAGTAALAKAGTGDVLAGMIGALLAQGLSAEDACALGATLHAEAGRISQSILGDISVCAEDVVHSIPDAIGYL